jgi:citrate lyase beta subunit
MNYPIRSILVLIPSIEAYSKISAIRADWLLLDMEDSVPIEKKSTVRQFLSEQLKQNTFAEFKLLIRLNTLEDLDEVKRDIQYLIHHTVDGFILPKIHSRKDVEVYDELLLKAETEHGLDRGQIKFLPVIESPQAVLNAEEIAGASSRNSALILGQWDLSSLMKIDPNPDALTYARQKIVMAACAFGLEAIDSPCLKLDNPVALEKECLYAKSLGFSGKIAIHPNQVNLINHGFSLSPQAVQWAEKVMKGKTVGITVQNDIQGREMIGPPHVRHAQDILNRSRIFPTKNQAGGIRGRMLKHSFDPENITIGSIIHSSFEITITDAWSLYWNASFFESNKLNSSQLAAQKIGLENSLIPITLLLSLCAGLSVTKLSQFGRFHLGFYDATYIRPVYAGDTLQNFFYVDKVRNSDGGNYTIIDTLHILINQNEEVVFRAYKSTMFAGADSKPLVKEDPKQLEQKYVFSSLLRDQIVRQVSSNFSNYERPEKLKPGDLIIHQAVKVFGASEARSLAILIHAPNPHHYDSQKFSPETIVVAGPLVVAASLAVILDDIGNIIYEEIIHCSNINRVIFDDLIGSLSYIINVKPIAGNEVLEEVTVKTLGIKNLDMDMLVDLELPEELFTSQPLKPSEFEEICQDKCPILYHKIACQTTRKLIRVWGE